MKLSRLITGLAVGFVLLAASAPAQQQVSIGVPIKLKQPKIKKMKYKGTVVSATMIAITVRQEKDMRMIQTFRLAPEASEKMVKILERGGYQVGDKVTIIHQQGSEIALEVKGKPSR
jgi:hypothetical protein